VDSHHGWASPTCIEFCGKSTLVLRAAAIGQGPTFTSRELRSRHPPVRLEVEKVLLDVAAIKTEAGRDLVSLREAQEAHRMKRQRGGV
jgi:hypothetical protein